MDATDRLCRMLDELGIEWWHDDDISPGHTEWMTDDAAYTSLGMDGDMLSVKAISKMTPEQAIAATVGERYYTYDEWCAINEAVGDAMEYAHEHAVMYPDKADPLWNIDEYVNRVLEVVYGPKDATVGRCDTMGLWTEWEQVLFANVSDEVAQDNLNECVHELLYKAATMGVGTLTAEQVRECSKGVYFEGYSDGATHRVNGIEETDWQAIADKLNATVGAGTCHMRLTYEEEDADGCIWPDHYECDACGAKVNGIMPFYDTEIPPRFCPNCGKKVVSE